MATFREAMEREVEEERQRQRLASLNLAPQPLSGLAPIASVPAGTLMPQPLQPLPLGRAGIIYGRGRAGGAVGDAIDTAASTLGRGALGAAHTTLDALDYGLGAPSRAATGAIGAVARGERDPMAVLRAAGDSARRLEGRTVRGGDVLERAGLLEGRPLTRAAAGLVLDIGVDPVLGPLAPLRALSLTRAGRAGRQFAPAYGQMRGYEKAAEAVRAAGQYPEAAAIAAEAARVTAEPAYRKVTRALGTAIGADVESPAAAARILRAQETAGLPTGLAPSWRQQGAAGQRALLQVYGKSVLPRRADEAILGAIGGSTDRILKAAMATRPGAFLTRLHVDTSGVPGTQDMERMAAFKRTGVSNDLATERGKIAELAKKKRVTEADAPEIWSLIEEPTKEIQKLGQMNRLAEGLVERMRAGGLRIIEPDFKSLKREMDDLSGAIKAARRTKDAQLVKDLSAKYAQAERRMDLYMESPASLLLDEAGGALAAAAGKRGKLGTAAATFRPQYDALVAVRDPLQAVVNAGGGTARAASRPQLGEITEAFRKHRDALWKAERDFGIETPQLMGRMGYAPHVLAPEGREFLKLKAGEDLADFGILEDPRHAAMKPREYRDLTSQEINAMIQRGEITRYAGRDISAFPKTADFLTTDPYLGFEARAMGSAKAHGGMTYLNEIVDLAQQQGNVGVPLVAKLKGQDIPLPGETMSRLAKVKLPEEQARYVAKMIGLYTQPKEQSGLLGLAHALTNAWKINATLQNSPIGFNARNFYNNLLQMWLADVGPRHLLGAAELQAANPTKLAAMRKYVPGLGHEVSGQELMKLAAENGAFEGTAFGVEELGSTLAAGQKLKGVPYTGRILLNPYNPQSPVLGTALNVGRQIPFIGDLSPLARASGTAARAIENNAKLTMFLGFMERGMGPRQAGELVRKHLFDYGRLTEDERKFGKLFIPFLTWASKNARLQAKTLLSRPSKIATQVKALKEYEREQPSLTPAEQYDVELKTRGRMPVVEGGTTSVLPTGELEPSAAVSPMSAVLPMAVLDVVGQPAIEAYRATREGSQSEVRPAWERVLGAVSASGGKMGAANISPAFQLGAALFGEPDNPFTGQPINRMGAAVRNVPALARGAPPTRETFWGRSQPATAVAFQSQLAPGLASLNRLNPTLPGTDRPLFGTTSAPGLIGDMPRPARRDVTPAERWRRYTIGVSTIPVGTERDDISYMQSIRASIPGVIAAIRAKAREAQAAPPGSPAREAAMREVDEAKRWLMSVAPYLGTLRSELGGELPEERGP